MNNLKIAAKSDFVGTIASGMCLAHCVATPFLFAAHTAHVQGHHSHPFWWGLIDLLFIAISFLAVFWSARNTSKYWMKFALWVSWTLLAMAILNEKLQLIPIIEAFIYIPSSALVLLHLYNRKYCKCEKDCCARSK